MAKHEHLGLHVHYNGTPCRIISVIHSSREAIGGVAYALLPEGCRSLQSSIQYICAEQIEFPPFQNEILETVAYCNKLKLIAGTDL